VIRSSFFAATDASDIPDSVSMQMADIFQGELDFRRGLRKGDRFAVVYESLEADGELRAGRVLSTEFYNNGKSHQAMWFQEAGKKGAYYTLDGKSLRQAYLNSPWSSRASAAAFPCACTPSRKPGAPIWAPTSRPHGHQGAHRGRRRRVLCRRTKRLRQCDLCRSRQPAHHRLCPPEPHRRQARSTRGPGRHHRRRGLHGWATGPHLHFEFRDKGEQRDPLTIAQITDAAQPISKAARPAFEQQAAQMRIELNAGTQAFAVASAR
jgi:hypothetical protein